MSTPLIVITGPTASNKTNIAISLAKLINAEIISADSLQVYKHMNIATSKPVGTWTTINGKNSFCVNTIPHYMIDIIEPNNEFNTGKYVSEATKIIDDIYNRKKIPILVGGTGLYIKAVLEGLCPAPSSDPALREQLKIEAKEKGIDSLYNYLKEVDPEKALQIHPTNLQRIIRAVEVYKITGIPFSKIQKKTHGPNYNALIIGLSWERATLYDRINQRVDTMIQEGLVSESQELLNRGYNKNLPSMQGLGYKHIINYLDGKIDLATAVSLIKRDTRRYAKRQLTWFKKDTNIHWIKMNESTNIEQITNEICSLISDYPMFCIKK